MDDENAIPQCLDKLPTTKASATYAKTLSQQYQSTPMQANTATQYCKPPPQANQKSALFKGVSLTQQLRHKH